MLKYDIEPPKKDRQVKNPTKLVFSSIFLGLSIFNDGYMMEKWMWGIYNIYIRYSVLGGFNEQHLIKICQSSVKSGNLFTR